jgi:hypothetical protein
VLVHVLELVSTDGEGGMMTLEGLTPDERYDVLREANDLLDFVDQAKYHDCLLLWDRTSTGIQVICLPIPKRRADA